MTENHNSIGNSRKEKNRSRVKKPLNNLIFSLKKNKSDSVYKIFKLLLEEGQVTHDLISKKLMISNPSTISNNLTNLMKMQKKLIQSLL